MHKLLGKLRSSSSHGGGDGGHALAAATAVDNEHSPRRGRVGVAGQAVMASNAAAVHGPLNRQRHRTTTTAADAAAAALHVPVTPWRRGVDAGGGGGGGAAVLWNDSVFGSWGAASLRDDVSDPTTTGDFTHTSSPSTSPTQRSEWHTNCGDGGAATTHDDGHHHHHHHDNDEDNNNNNGCTRRGDEGGGDGEGGAHYAGSRDGSQHRRAPSSLHTSRTARRNQDVLRFASCIACAATARATRHDTAAHAMAPAASSSSASTAATTASAPPPPPPPRGPFSADVLCTVFLYVNASSLDDMLQVSRVCRFWRYYSNYAPHWTHFRYAALHRAHTHLDEDGDTPKPPHNLAAPVASAAAAAAAAAAASSAAMASSGGGGGGVAVVTRDEWVAERRAAHEEAQRSRLLTTARHIRWCAAVALTAAVMLTTNYVLAYLLGYLPTAVHGDVARGATVFVMMVVLALGEVAVVLAPLANSRSLLPTPSRAASMRVVAWALLLLTVSVVLGVVTSLAFARVRGARVLLRGSTMDCTADGTPAWGDDDDNGDALSCHRAAAAAATTTATRRLTTLLSPTFALVSATLDDVRWRPLTLDATEQTLQPYCITSSPPSLQGRQEDERRRQQQQQREQEPEQGDQQQRQQQHVSSHPATMTAMMASTYCFVFLFFDADYRSAVFANATALHSGRNVGTRTALGYDPLARTLASPPPPPQQHSTSSRAYDAMTECRSSSNSSNSSNNRISSSNSSSSSSRSTADAHGGDYTTRPQQEQQVVTMATTTPPPPPPLVAVVYERYATIAHARDVRFSRDDDWLDAQRRPHTLSRVSYLCALAPRDEIDEDVYRYGDASSMSFPDALSVTGDAATGPSAGATVAADADAAATWYRDGIAWQAHHIPLVTLAHVGRDEVQRRQAHYYHNATMCYVVTAVLWAVMLAAQCLLKRHATVVLGVTTVLALLVLNPVTLIVAGVLCVRTNDDYFMCSAASGGALIGSGISMLFLLLTVYVAARA